MPKPESHPELSKRELRLLMQVVDGSLPSDQRLNAELLLRDTERGRRALQDNRRVATLLRDHGPVMPHSLRLGIDAAYERAARPATRVRSGFALAGGLAAVLIALALALPGLLSGGPSAGDAIALGRLPAKAPAPAAAPQEPKRLQLDVEGVVFPNWEAKFGWQPTGARTDEVGGRTAETVFYRAHGHEVAYTILSGAAIDTPGRTETVNGVEVSVSRDGQRDVVTFERDGHTCVLSGDVDHPETLLKLAAWKI